MAKTWQQRVDELGLNRADLGILTGHDRVSLYRHLNGKLLNGTTVRLRSLIIALEIMRPAQRTEWLHRMRIGEADL